MRIWGSEAQPQHLLTFLHDVQNTHPWSPEPPWERPAGLLGEALRLRGQGGTRQTQAPGHPVKAPDM